MHRWGFPSRWRSWVMTLLSTATSKVLMNGAPGENIQHGRGLRQGNPLSPLLFVLAIDPLQKWLHLATEKRTLSKLRGKSARICLSLYADGAVIFINPTAADVQNIKELLDKFGRVIGLSTDIQKSLVAPICCNRVDLDSILASFPAARPKGLLALPLTRRNTIIPANAMPLCCTSLGQNIWVDGWTHPA